MATLTTDILATSVAAPVLCAHCGLEVPAGLIEPEAQTQFCCTGCQAVYQTLHSCGLEAFYRLRDTAGRPVVPSNSKFASFDTPAFQKLYSEISDRDTLSADLVLEGVNCAACVWLLERLPHVVPGVVEARLSLRQSVLRVRWNPQHAKLSEIAAALDHLGYTPHPAKGVSRKTLFVRQERKRMVDLAAAGALMGNTMLIAFALYAGRSQHMESLYFQFFRWLSAIFGLTSLAFPGRVFFRGALAAIRLRRVNLDVPIALALFAGGLAGTINVLLNRGDIYFDTLTVLVFLLLVGRFLQFRQQRYADDAVELLFSLAPSTCRIIRDAGRVEELPIEALAAGDLIEIRSGDTVAADGIVETGQSSVLQALLTGESLPVPVQVGSQVFAGALNQGAALHVRVSSIGENSRMGRLMQVVERGISEKPAIVQFADRVGAWFVLIVSVAAAATFAYWSRFALGPAIDHSIALLIVTCPCALGLATPLTLAMIIGRLARQDVLVKSGAAIEKLSGRGEILLDKTGTLTLGRLQLLCYQGPENLKPAIAELESHSQHPIARALVESCGPPGSNDFSLESIEDSGVGGLSAVLRRGSSAFDLRIGSPDYIRRSCAAVSDEMSARQLSLEQSGATVVFVALNQTVIGLAALGDRLRDDTAAAIAEIRTLGWSPRILSGDAPAVVESIARAAGIDASRADGQMTPEAKLANVQKFRAGGTVVMVGDGVNDAAALASADVGIAVHGGAEASLSAADVFIATPGIAPVAHLIRCARRTMRTIHRNLCISLAYNLLAGALAAAGKMNPLVAAVLMPISSATVLALAITSVRRIGKSRPFPGESL
jgi:Cu2+-exporting ATPase